MASFSYYGTECKKKCRSLSWSIKSFIFSFSSVTLRRNPFLFASRTHFSSDDTQDSPDSAFRARVAPAATAAVVAARSFSICFDTLAACFLILSSARGGLSPAAGISLLGVDFDKRPPFATAPTACAPPLGVVPAPPVAAAPDADPLTFG